MQKRDRLYTVNKWNKNLFAYGDRMEDGSTDLSIPGGLMEGVGLSSTFTPAISGTISGLENNIKPLTIGPANSNGGPSKALGIIGNIAGGLGSAGMGTKLISDGYSTGGIGEGISSLGKVAGQFGPWGKVAEFALDITGGLVNRIAGVKENKKNINSIKANGAAARDAGNALGQAATTSELLNAAGNMVTGSGFDTTDLYKGGWSRGAKRRAAKKGRKLLNQERTDLAYQTNALATGADNVDSYKDRDVLGSFKMAEGGFLPMINTDNMGAIEYGFMNDWLTNKKRQTEGKEALGNSTLFAEGGDENDRWAGVPNWKLPPSVLLPRLEAKRKAARKPKPVPGVFGGGEFGGGNTSGTFEVGENTFPQARDFNEAYDMAVANRLSTFTFNNKRYNTKKENNPIREINNRLAGQLRVRDEQADTVYDRKPYMIGTAEENTPLITDRNFRGLGGTLFAIGGDMQTNGADWSTGLTHINAGQSHELNPYEGVQVGVDSEGTPNLVEEGETIYNDYVYSNRIELDEEAKKAFHIGKKREITYAEMSKKLEKEAAERPNDPLSKAALQKQMEELANHQERQKQEMEAERAEEYFNSLSDEEKVALMQQVAGQQAQEEAIMQEAAAQQQPTQEEVMAAQQQMSPEEAAMIQQQMQGQPVIGQPKVVGGQPMMAEGGKINKFDLGGQAYTRMLNSLGFHTQKEFDEWAKENNIDFGDVWKDNPNILNRDILGALWGNENFIKALQKKNPALAHAFKESGYDWGTLTPNTSNKATIQSINRGNWKNTNGTGWFGSEDLAFKQATSGLTDDEIKALTTEELAERMRSTEAYKNTSKWLENSDNALLYLNTLLNDPDTPEVAKQYARKFIQDGNWKNGFDYNYATVFGSNGRGVRETNPGTYWHTALEANRGNKTGNFVINDDGTIEEIIGDVPTNWANAGNYTWADEANDFAYNYYKRPKVEVTSKDGATEEDGGENRDKKIVPVTKAEWPRYAGLFGPITGLGLMAAGIGKPDYNILNGVLDKFEESGTRLADYQRIGNYLVYRPMDIWAEQNRMDANSRATDRAILNNAAPIGTQMAGALANAYTSQLGSGQLYRNALEYNDNLRKQVADFNRATDMFNAQAYNQTSQTNAGIRNQDRSMRAQLAMDAAKTRMDADAGWYNSLYGNVSGLFKGISDLGRENAERNMLARLAASGALGTITPENAINAGLVKYAEAAEGGKLKRKKNKKRGLTV